MNQALKISIGILILIVGVTSNILGLIIFARKRFRKFSTRYIYITILAIDVTYVLFRVLMKLDWLRLTQSDLLCKLNLFIVFGYFPTSSYLQSYVSFERFISIKYPRVKFVKKISSQCVIITVTAVYSIGLYSPLFVWTSSNKNNTNNCVMDSAEHLTIDLIDLINTCLIPFILTSVFTGLLVHTIFKSRLAIIRMNNQRDRNRLKKDIKFAVSSVFLNILFFTFNFPACIVNTFFLSESDLMEVLDFLFYASFCINFYVLIFFNSIFRKEFFLFMKLK